MSATRWQLSSFEAVLEIGDAASNDPNNATFNPNSTEFWTRTHWTMERYKVTNDPPASGGISSISILGPAYRLNYQTRNITGTSFVVTFEGWRPEDDANNRLVHGQTLERFSEWELRDLKPGFAPTDAGEDWRLEELVKSREWSETSANNPASSSFTPASTQFWTRTHFVLNRHRMTQAGVSGARLYGTGLLSARFRLAGATAILGGTPFVITRARWTVAHAKGNIWLRQHQTLERYTEWSKEDFAP